MISDIWKPFSTVSQLFKATFFIERLVLYLKVWHFSTEEKNGGSITRCTSKKKIMKFQFLFLFFVRVFAKTSEEILAENVSQSWFPGHFWPHSTLNIQKKSRLRRSGGQKCQNQSPNFQNFQNFGAKWHFFEIFFGLKSFNATEKIFEIKKSPLWKTISPCSQQFKNTLFTRKLAQCPEMLT